MSALHGNFMEEVDDPPAAADTAEPITKEFKALVKLLELKFGEYDIQSMTDAKKIIKATTTTTTTTPSFPRTSRRRRRRR